jgi:hypothetical protein
MRPKEHRRFIVQKKTICSLLLDQRITCKTCNRLISCSQRWKCDIKWSLRKTLNLIHKTLKVMETFILQLNSYCKSFIVLWLPRTLSMTLSLPSPLLKVIVRIVRMSKGCMNKPKRLWPKPSSFLTSWWTKFDSLIEKSWSYKHYYKSLNQLSSSMWRQASRIAVSATSQLPCVEVWSVLNQLEMN